VGSKVVSFKVAGVNVRIVLWPFFILDWAQTPSVLFCKISCLLGMPKAPKELFQKLTLKLLRRTKNTFHTLSGGQFVYISVLFTLVIVLNLYLCLLWLY